MVLSFIGLSAARSNKILNMQKYMIGVIVFGLIPVFYCIIHYMNDVISYMQLEDGVELEDVDNILVWQVSLALMLLVALKLISQFFRIFPTDCFGMDSHLLPFKSTPSRSTSPGTCAVHGKREARRRLNKLST